MNDYQHFIALSRYSRYREDLGRRETWEETVDRYVDNVLRPGMESGTWQDPGVCDMLVRDIREAILNLDAMPSMRMIATAGKALDRDNVAGYNCAYTPVDSVRVFDETLYILCCGTGVGFSVERQYVQKLPQVAEHFYPTDSVIKVRDSKIGWASALRELISLLYGGLIPQWDLSSVREAGAPLKTFGGRASGPEPLDRLFRFTVSLFRGAAGRQLSSIECHDLMCKIAEIVVVGGVRRSALISLSNFSDQRMASAKHGAWYESDKQRALANNSTCFTERPDYGNFIKEWVNIYESKSGERGIFNRVAAQRKADLTGRRDSAHEFGTNPCSEIILRPRQFCNLSEVVVRSTDTMDDLKRKVRYATSIGTIQSTYTNFRYIGRRWATNCEEERLLGVSLTGIMDNALLSNPKDPLLASRLEELRSVAVETNRDLATILGIQPSTAITCVKPSGTVSQLVDSSSGIHARYSSQYIRRVRADNKDPLAKMMIDQGMPYDIEGETVIFSFPQEAPKGSKLEGDLNSVQMLELWKIYQDHWCEHKPSVTIHYKDAEYLAIGQWLWDNWDSVSGIAFLPYSDHIYEHAPYEQINSEQYREMVAALPSLDWAKLEDYEQGDNTAASHELACSGSSCEIVDLTG